MTHAIIALYAAATARETRLHGGDFKHPYYAGGDAKIGTACLQAMDAALLSSNAANS
ncbi:MAG: hypothetical protein ACSLEN_03865 [Candidatus Malihini olakiniferum]